LCRSAGIIRKKVEKEIEKEVFWCPSRYPGRDVAQSGRAQRSGRWGRRFESSRPDHFKGLAVQAMLPQCCPKKCPAFFIHHKLSFSLKGWRIATPSSTFFLPPFWRAGSATDVSEGVIFAYAVSVRIADGQVVISFVSVDVSLFPV
jgi:hypothetical protein